MFFPFWFHYSCLFFHDGFDHITQVETDRALHNIIYDRDVWHVEFDLMFGTHTDT